MNKSRRNKALTIGLLTAGIISLSGVYLINVHAEKTGVYSQNGGSASKSDKTYVAAATDVSGIYVRNSGIFSLNNGKIIKAGDTSSVADSDFYGLNAGALAESGSTVTLTDCDVTTQATGANGVFAYGEGSSVTVNNVTINTTKDSSRGIGASYTGAVTANSCTVTTNGAHCAAISSVRGAGTLIVRGGTFTTSGTDSPPIYCTGNFEIMGATLKGTGSEAAVIEGANTITIWDCTLSGAKKQGVMIYQNMPGDATETTGTFNMTGGTLTAAAGPLFYVTNSTGNINLTAVAATAASGILVQAAAGIWGTSGANGGTAILTANMQTLNGNLICDSSSSITATLTNDSSLTGAINTAALALDDSSTWRVTGDSYLTSLNDADTTFANIDDNGHTIYYDSSRSANSWLGGNTYYLNDGGKLTPGTPPASATPTSTVTASNEPEPSATPSAVVSPSATVTATPTPSATATVRPTVTIRPTPTVSPTATVRPTPTVSPTATVRPTVTIRPTPTVRPTITVRPTPTVRPTSTPRPSHRRHWWWWWRWPWWWWK
jgi:hypothetical protein